MPRSLDPSRTLAARFPTLAAQWHPERNDSGPGRYDPGTIPASSPATVWWRCDKGHEWQDKVATRTAMPKWKNGDVATCPECVRSPTRLVTYTYPGCGHTRTVQRKNAEKNQRNCWDCGGDPDPARDAARRERRRALALASYHRHKARGGALTDDERAAQRALVGFVRSARVEVTQAGLTWWRDTLTAEVYGSTTAKDLSVWLTVLQVKHSVALRSRDGEMEHREIGIHVSRENLAELGRWAPSYVETIAMRARLVGD